jgi:hypothetical protein
LCHRNETHGVCMSYHFKGFADFWSHTRSLPQKRRQTIFSGLSAEERAYLEEDLVAGGWKDLINRDRLDKKLNQIQKKYNCNLLVIRVKVMTGNSQLVRRSFWKRVVDIFKGEDPADLYYIFGNMDQCEYAKDSDWILLSLHKEPVKDSNTESSEESKTATDSEE